MIAALVWYAVAIALSAALVWLAPFVMGVEIGGRR